MRRHTVKLSADHLTRQAACSAERAVEELIWNALDAGGERVRVSFEQNELGAVSAVEVQDWGTGIAATDLGRTFGMVGNSLKNQHRVTADERNMSRLAREASDCASVPPPTDRRRVLRHRVTACKYRRAGLRQSCLGA